MNEQPVNVGNRNTITSEYNLTGNYMVGWMDIIENWQTVSFLTPSRGELHIRAHTNWDDIMDRVMRERKEAWEILAQY